MTQAIDNAAITLLRLANGYQISQAIHVAAELKVADIIGDDRYPSRILRHVSPPIPVPVPQDGWLDVSGRQAGGDRRRERRPGRPVA
jgi:hypothetical protein